MSKKRNIYLPKLRSYYSPSKEDLRCYSANGKGYVTIPDPTKDPVVSNNIATWEFDYTDSLFDDNLDLF
ncbi:hypothetical protein [Clostridium fallax]|uniref:Uncharacterized protein n=1 Tax=Clostridium fallax TaxID=1533 RepID=A0A1M4XRK7_9CLOT|nr:hypothetical protein [Clostridium fallax]SHE96091.1 hypothetical protein SAMN05443638_12021 [Clostridium fallax]SQB08073.1 Uncharacterised protein [Clostridium fallax]